MTTAELSKKGGTRWIITNRTFIHLYVSTRASRAAWDWHTDKGQTKDVTLSCINFKRAWSPWWRSSVVVIVVAIVIWAFNSFRSAGFSDIDSLKRKKNQEKSVISVPGLNDQCQDGCQGQNLNESLKASRFTFSALVIVLQEVGS